MDLSQVKIEIDKYIEKSYYDYKKKLDEANSYSVVEQILKLEESTLKNYCVSIRKSVVNDVELYILKNNGVDAAEKFSLTYNFETPYFNKIVIRENDAYKTKIVKKAINTGASNDDKSNLSYILVSGVVTGFAGAILGSKKFGPAGGVIGGLGGAGIGILASTAISSIDSNKENNTSTKIIEKKVKELDKGKIRAIFDRRKKEVKNGLIDYVEEIENALMKYSRGY